MREHKCNSKPLFLNGAAATPASPSNKKFWEFRNAAETGGTAELLLYGDISRKSWWGDEVTPQAFAADLATIPAMDDLTVRICSGGGDVWAAQAIGAMLENRLGTVTAQIEGICASAATIVASHCKVVKAAEDATYMIHPIKVNPNGFVDMEGLKQLMDALTVMRTNVLNQYAKKTGHTVEEVAAWMDATSWWTAAEAKENGFIDEITESNQTAKIENRNGALFVNSIAVPGTFDDAPEFVRNRAVVAPATTEGFVNNTDPEGKPDKNDGGNDMEFKNADELRNGCPDLVKEIVDEAHAEAQKQERDRLAAIDEIADAVPSDLVAEAKYGDKACSAEQLAYRAALDAKKKGHKLLDDTEDDADTSGANSVGGAAPDGVSGTGTKNKNQTDAEKRAMVKNLFHPKKEG
ncbi:MAG: Clp protease ClpP [Subdoligranulum variabile]|uniref:Clp protease ClpP n=1 Tax=Subdoligranulum variabile TaxID=214851 RepID=A0A943HLS2_9FIRM|nr:Clp protease ClpP [Subdoligranulum variabile]